MPIYTSDNIAIGIIAEGRRVRTGEGKLDHPALSEKGIVIALATGLVESRLKMYANEKVLDSYNFPHDAVGDDGFSVGVFQQQIRRGDTGEWWWADTGTCMDVAKSAALFFNSLIRQRIGQLDYNTNANSPGGWAQMVQRSAFPGRYDEEMAEAQGIYNRLSNVVAAPQPGTAPPAIPLLVPKFTEIEMYGNGYSSRSRPPTNFLLHTEEGNSTAEQLARYCDGRNNVSYHYTIRDGRVYYVVDTDYYSWSVLDANVFTINACFAGSYAGFTREQWLLREHDIEIAAYLAVQDCRKYNFSLDVITPPYHRATGISDHKYVTECLGIGNHTDVGNNFPWDVFAKYVLKYSQGIVVNEDGEAMSVLDEQFESLSGYRTPGEGKIGTWCTIDRNKDKMLHEFFTEWNAIMFGDYDSIARIFRSANGRGADTSEAFLRKSNAAWAKIPTEYKEAWVSSQEKKALT